MESKLRTALSDIQDGIPIDKVANSVHWKDFEGLVAEILQSMHFEVSRNFRMKKPTIEIDVVGKRLDVIMLIDCKHWKRMSHSNLKIIVNKQIKRAEQFIQNKKINKYYFHHEQSCTMAADVYARIKRKPAVVCVTTGPGGINAKKKLLKMEGFSF